MGGNGEESARWQLSPRRGDDVGGAAIFSMRGGASRVGVVGKATGRGFARGVLRSEDGGGRNRTEARRHRWRPFMSARWCDRGKGARGLEWKGGRGEVLEGGSGANGRHAGTTEAASDQRGRGPLCMGRLGGAAVACAPLLLWARPTRIVTFSIYSEEFQKEAT
jgi:hypothetical protein